MSDLTPRKHVRFWIPDCILCWFALCGMANAAVAVASFTNTERRAQFVQEIWGTPAQRLTYIAISTTISATGFTYMLWRYRWRYRLLTLFKIALSWFAMFAAVATNITIGMLVIGVLIFAYTIYWASQPKGMPNGRS
jgi:hypothetical protein